MSVYQIPAVQMHLVMIPLVHLHAHVTLATLVMDTIVQVKCSTIRYLYQMVLIRQVKHKLVKLM